MNDDIHWAQPISGRNARITHINGEPVDGETISQCNRVRGHVDLVPITEDDRTAIMAHVCPDCGLDKDPGAALCQMCIDDHQAFAEALAEHDESVTFIDELAPGEEHNGRFRCLKCDEVMPAYQMHGHAEWHRYIDAAGVCMPGWLALFLKALFLAAIGFAAVYLTVAIVKWRGAGPATQEVAP